jgi:hypothetical protein
MAGMETDTMALSAEHESRLDSYQQELANTRARLLIQQRESIETKLHCDFMKDTLLQQIHRMEIIQEQFELTCDENKDKNIKYPENIFDNLYQFIETIPKLKEREKLLHEVKLIQNTHEELILEHMETISALTFELKNSQSENSQRHQVEDLRLEKVRQQNITMGSEIKRLEKELLESKFKGEQLKTEIHRARASQEKQSKESLEKLARGEAEVRNLQITLQSVRDELSSVKRDFSSLEPKEDLFPGTHTHIQLRLDPKSDLDDGREEQKTIRRRSLHRASSLTDPEVSYQTLRSEYFQCQLELGIRDQTILALGTQLKSKESELLIVQNSHSAVVTCLKNELSELRSKLANQDLSALSMLSDTIKRSEISQIDFVRNLSGMIEEKIDGKSLKEKPREDPQQITDCDSQLAKNYQMEIASLKEELQLKDQEIRRLNHEIQKRRNESQFEVQAAMDGLRRQMEGFKTDFLQSQSSSSSLSKPSDEHDTESLSKV